MPLWIPRKLLQTILNIGYQNNLLSARVLQSNINRVASKLSGDVLQKNKSVIQIIRKYSSDTKADDYRYKYDAKVEMVINKQIEVEQQAAQDYLSMAVTFLHPCVSRPGAGGYFMRMYEEEVGHMQDFVNYQLLRGGTTIIKGLKAPTQNMKLTLLEAFQKGLAMEKYVTSMLENIVVTAESVKDYQCADFITSVFLAEQMKSVSEMAHHVTKLSRLCDEHAVYHYDLELAKNYPYTFKRKAD